MQTQVNARLVTAVMLAGLLASTLLGAQTAGAQPAQGGSDRVPNVQAAVAAFNAGDTATLTTLFDPSFQDVTREEETLSATTAADLRTLFASPAGQTNLLSVVQQWVTAANAGDTASLKTILDPSFQGVTTNMPPDAPPQLRQPGNRDAALQDAGQRLVQVTASHCAQTSANTVRCDIAVSGGPSAHLPHPWTATAVFTFANGKIVRYVQTLSETTRNDLAQIFANLPQPQRMPDTGRPDGTPGSASLFFLLACA
ncbi:MAG: hypothetical protein M3328_05195, partial [Chloroflexota bacterium]|nr:hypothetical protein [Chloroflexota bacterium]